MTNQKQEFQNKSVQEVTDSYVSGEITEDQLERELDKKEPQELRSGRLPTKESNDSGDMSDIERVCATVASIPDTALVLLFRALRSSKDSWVTVDRSTRTVEITYGDLDDDAQQTDVIEQAAGLQKMWDVISPLLPIIFSLGILLSLPHEMAQEPATSTVLLLYLALGLAITSLCTLGAPNPRIDATVKGVGSHVVDRD